ncbi:D-glycero-D-manno-heptose 1,7-bisphosphate phosphatase [uncultured bacterium]|nr:D-glycero-D-manno-heptose 1,7-bisphosphate phosphatase [uncultured bacterium]
MNRALFLDRDGTINYDPGFVTDPAQVTLLDGVGENLARIKNELGFMLIVVSNQSGISRGIMTRDQVDLVNERVNQLLGAYGVSVDRFCYCPHHPLFSTPEEVQCRKPSPQMILNAAQQESVSLADSYMIGDKQLDIEAGYHAGVRTILIKTGHGEATFSALHNQKILPNFVAGNFSEVYQIIQKELS